MSNSFQAKKISEYVYWVGAIDNEIRNFHGYSTARGTTYNAFLILGQKPILIDTVKEPFFPEMLERISSVINPEEISYIISNHAEMDHSGALLPTIQAIKPEKIFTSKMGALALNAHFHKSLELTEITPGENFTLGDANFTCIETRMLHWPDSMFTYFANDEILFSQDGFGMHLATYQLFSSKNDHSIMHYEAMKYFANILLPYAAQVAKLLTTLLSLNLDIKILAPDHGPVWDNQTDINWIIERWQTWARQPRPAKAVISYDTMWHSTAKMAHAIADGITAENIVTKMLPISGYHRSDIATELLEAGVFILGSPTINNQLFPTVADLVCYLKGLKIKNLMGQVFGSYGWSADAVRILQAEFTNMEIQLLGNPIKSLYVPDHECLLNCRSLGQNIAKGLKNGRD